MGSPTYHTCALVLRKTKLSESDLILTLLSQDGSQLRAIAKGARKPTSSFSSRLELFSVVDLLCSKGRTLDIVKEVRLVEGNEQIRLDFERMYAASPIVELLALLSQPDLSNSRLFDSTCTALRAMSSCDISFVNTVCAAQLLKLLAFDGLRPSLVHCISCGESMREVQASYFSLPDGGAVCANCKAHFDTIQVSRELLYHCEYLMMSPFSEILQKSEVHLMDTVAVIRLIQGLIQVHIGTRLKSLEQLMSFSFTM